MCGRSDADLGRLPSKGLGIPTVRSNGGVKEAGAPPVFPPGNLEHLAVGNLQHLVMAVVHRIEGAGQNQAAIALAIAPGCSETAARDRVTLETIASANLKIRMAPLWYPRTLQICSLFL